MRTCAALMRAFVTPLLAATWAMLWHPAQTADRLSVKWEVMTVDTNLKVAAISEQNFRVCKMQPNVRRQQSDAGGAGECCLIGQQRTMR